MKDFPNIAVLCLSWNSCFDTVATLKSLREVDYPKRALDLVVVDNGSTDGSASLLKRVSADLQKDGFRNVKIVLNKTNVGIPAAYNQGYEFVGEDVFAVLRIESDLRFTPNFLKEMVSLLVVRRQAAVVGGLIKSFMGDENHCGAIYYFRHSPGFRVCYPAVPTKCDGVLGCTMLVRKSSIDLFPYFFRPDLFINSDETELSLRYASRALETWYLPQAIVFHKSGTSTGKMPSISRYYSIRNGVLLAREYAGSIKLMVSLGYWFLWGMRRYVSGDKIPICAFFDGLSHRKDLSPRPALVDLNQRLP